MKQGCLLRTGSSTDEGFTTLQKNKCGDNCRVLFQSMYWCTTVTVPHLHQSLKCSPMATTTIRKQWRLMCLSYGRAAARIIIRLFTRP